MSRARNIGLQNVGNRSTIIGFPDDDCWYNDSVLEQVMNEISEKKIGFLCCGVYDPIRNQTYGTNRKMDVVIPINISNSFKLPISVGIFVKSDIILNKFKFDEKFGVGAEWGSGEESDLILYLLKENITGEYYSFDAVYHEVEDAKSGSLDRTFKYAKGNGALVVKSLKLRKQYKVLLPFMYIVFRTFCSLLLFIFNRGKRNTYFNRLKGLMSGFIEGVRWYYNA